MEIEGDAEGSVDGPTAGESCSFFVEKNEELAYTSKNEKEEMCLKSLTDQNINGHYLEGKETSIEYAILDGEFTISNKDENTEIEEQLTCELENGQNAVDLVTIGIEETAQQLSAVSETEESKENKDMWCFELEIDANDFLIQTAGSFAEFKGNEGCFWKGCKWSPDGLCILTNSDDNILRIFNLPASAQQNCSSNETVEEMIPELKLKEGDVIYDYDWYPYMSSYEPSSCCLIATSKDHPIHLWDAFSGQIRCSYLSYNHLDELVSPHSLAFNLDGSKIYCGFNKMIRIFDSSRPGRECQEYATVVKNTSLIQSGIISCISFSNKISSMFALGSFAKSVGIYSEKDSDLIYMLSGLTQGKRGGITQVQFSKDGLLLYAGARRDNNISCWDLRKPNEVLFELEREVETNQRIQFDIHRSDRYLFTGNTNGLISVWELSGHQLPKSNHLHAHHDAVNGLSLHPYLPLVASSSGQRHFHLAESASSESDDSEHLIDSSLRIWKYRE